MVNAAGPPHELGHTRALEEVGVPVRIALLPRAAGRGGGACVHGTAGGAGGHVSPAQACARVRVFWTRLRSVALEAVEAFRPDVVLVGHDMSMAWAEDLPADLPAVLTCHNQTWNWYESRAALAGRALRLALLGEAWRYRRFVATRLRRVHTAVAVATIERDQLLEIGGHARRADPTGVHVVVLKPAPPRTALPGRCSPDMSYPPNHQVGSGWSRDLAAGAHAAARCTARIVGRIRWPSWRRWMATTGSGGRLRSVDGALVRRRAGDRCSDPDRCWDQGRDHRGALGEQAGRVDFAGLRRTALEAGRHLPRRTTSATSAGSVAAPR